MSSVRDGQFTGRPDVNAASDLETASVLLDRIERAHAHRFDKRADLRKEVGRRLSTALGTLENIRRLRLKTVPSWLMDRIRAELVAVLSHEITKLTHEIAIHRQAGAHHSTDALLAAEAQVEAAKKILGRTE